MLLSAKLIDSLHTAVADIARYDYESNAVPEVPGIFDGYSGLALFYYHASILYPEDGFLEKAVFYFERAFNTMDIQKINLSHGATGVMWLLNYLAEEEIIDPSEAGETLSQYDRFLLRSMDCYSDNIDPMHGLLSIGNYWLSRKDDLARQGLEKILGMIEEQKLEDANGIFWENSVDDPETGSMRHINFGYAHGILTIAFFLSKLIKAGIASDRCGMLLKEALRYSLSFMNTADPMYFPGRIQRGEIKKVNRITYCYGDLGIACGLTAIAGNTGDARLMRLARELAENVARLALGAGGDIYDIGLCHGAAGNGYMFFKLYHLHNSEVLLQAAISQYERLLSLRGKTGGIGGFTAIDFDDDDKRFYRRRNPGFIEGTAGVGLAVISFLLKGGKNKWDEILYLS